MMERNATTDLELCDRATPGPWFQHDEDGVLTGGVGADSLNCTLADCTWPDNPVQDAANAALIAAAREALPYWIRRCLAAEDEVARLELVAQGCGDECDKCGWNMKLPNEPCRCELQHEVYRLRGGQTAEATERVRVAFVDLLRQSGIEPYCDWEKFPADQVVKLEFEALLRENERLRAELKELKEPKGK